MFGNYYKEYSHKREMLRRAKFPIKNSHVACLLFGIVIVYACATAYQSRFLQDDAFISFRYAKNLAAGQGLVFNPGGEKVEGYTNFLYTIVMVIPHYLGLNIFVSSYFVTGLFWLLSLVFSFLIARKVFHASTTLSLGVVAFLSLNQTFSIYATGGLETSMVCFFILASFFFLFHPENVRSKKHQTMAGVAAFCALLTRLDSAIFLFAFGVCYFLKLFFDPGVKRKELFKLLLRNSLHAVLLFAAYLVWKYFYYGSILPNTYYIKLSGVSNFARGFSYIASFFKAYFYWLSVLLLVFLIFYERLWLKELKKVSSKTINYAVLATFISILLSLAYIFKAGGGFMEYRYFVCVLPFLSFALLFLIRKISAQHSLHVSLLVLAIPTSFLNYKYEYKLPVGVESREQLLANIALPPRIWVTMGRQFERYFKDLPDVRIATSAAGAVPYYSELFTIDTLGLNDAWIAKNGLKLSSLPGHQRISSFEYLLDQKVDFHLGTPMVFSNNRQVAPSFFSSENINQIYWLKRDFNIEGTFNEREKEAWKKVKVIQMPIGREHFMFVLWLSTDSKILQEYIVQTGWQVFDLVRP